MATIHISEAEAVRGFASVLTKVHEGTEVIIDGDDTSTITVSKKPRPLTMRERIALMPDDSPAVDDEFAADVAEAHERFNQPLDPPAWD